MKAALYPYLFLWRSYLPFISQYQGFWWKVWWPFPKQEHYTKFPEPKPPSLDLVDHFTQVLLYCKMCGYVIIICFFTLLDCRYVESNPQYAECNVYLVKFRQLQVLVRMFFNHKTDLDISKFYSPYSSFCNSLELLVWFDRMFFQFLRAPLPRYSSFEFVVYAYCIVFISVDL